MSLIHPRDCLSYHLSRTLFRRQPIDHLPCSVLSSRLAVFRGTYTEHVNPEPDALTFYQLNHALALVQQRRHVMEPLPAPELALVQDYFTESGQAAQRALFYLLLITTREARHLADKSKWNAKLTETYGANAANYVSSIPDNSSEAVSRLETSPPDATLGAYVSALRDVFYGGKWSHGYGGKAWGEVTDCLRDFIYGRFSLAMLLDRVFELCHNNGPIFNKGMLYHCHEGDQITDRAMLLTILDAQRAGAIPGLICTPPAFIRKFVSTTMRARNDTLLSLFPELPREVDWNRVEELGSEHEYNHLKTEAQQKAPKPSKPTKKAKPVHVPDDMFVVSADLMLPKLAHIRKLAA